MKKYLLILLSVTFFLLLFSNIAYAINFKPQVDIGFAEGPITPSSLGNYIKAIYTYAIGVVGILSTVVIIFGGFLWATAAGNNSRVDNAKTWIGSALTGLVLALFSYTLLYMINPALVELGPINPSTVEPISGCCSFTDTEHGSRTDTCSATDSTSCAALNGTIIPNSYCQNNSCVPAADLQSGCCQHHNPNRRIYTCEIVPRPGCGVLETDTQHGGVPQWTALYRCGSDGRCAPL